MISVVICTYNRSNILSICLESFLSVASDKFKELIVVDNNSNDTTHQVVQNYQKNISVLKYVKEKQVGLSFARNTGWEIASGDWVVYLDDDTKVESNFISRIANTIEENNFDCIGGTFEPYYLNVKPSWIPDYFGKRSLISEKVKIINNPSEFAIGLIMAIRKSRLRELKGFDTQLGMNGYMLRYGEETDLQKRMMSKGYKIGFDPNWFVYHLVPSYKQSLRWILKSTFQKSLTTTNLNNPNITKVSFWFLTNLLRTYGKQIPLTILKGQAYPKRILLFALEPFLMFAGSIKAKLF